MQQSPKHIIKNFQNRNKSFGKERRLNMYKTVLDKTPHFPKTLSYEDIDRSVLDWVENSLPLYYDGKKFNTYKLFSNQRISEYGQTWKNLDEKGNLDINFKTLTREQNPQKGDMQGGFCNIPGDITFPIFKVKALDENGVEYMELYSMKQPVPVNLIYTVGVFTNSYSKINEINTNIQHEFKSIERYIFPNGFAIPMELSSISDESEYTIDDRKYYGQTYQIKVLGYIITSDDYVVKKIPSRLKSVFASGINSRNIKNDGNKFDIQAMSTTIKTESQDSCLDDEKIVESNDTVTIDDVMNTPIDEKEIEIEELCGKQVCWENTDDEFYVNRKVIISIPLTYCDNKCEFISDYHLGIESIELVNIKSYKLIINGLDVNPEDSDVEILIGDSVVVENTIHNEKEDAKITILAHDLDTIIKKDSNSPEEVIC